MHGELPLNGYRAGSDGARRLRRISILAVMAATIAGPAAASLGGTSTSVATDSIHMAAKRTSAAAATHVVHSLTLPNGGVTREFARKDGRIFAVTWRGPGRSDLRQLLGGYFEVMQAENARVARPRRLPLSVRRGDFILRSGGHPGAFWGAAYIPQLVPTGFSATDMQ